MKSKSLAVVVFVALLAACSSNTKSPDITDGLRKSLDQAGLRDVTVNQDRDKGIVTLTGHVPSDADKATAESIAKTMSGSQVVADQITVVAPGMESEAKKINSALDDGIESNLKAVLIKNHYDDVKYSAEAGVVTLSGAVSSQGQRTTVERLASGVPNVKQVVNELQVKDQKATSSTGSR